MAEETQNHSGEIPDRDLPAATQVVSLTLQAPLSCNDSQGCRNVDNMDEITAFSSRPL
jgi:hypothetical protein